MHNDDERTILTYVSSEMLELALANGYHVRAVHEVWAWTQCANIFGKMIGLTHSWATIIKIRL